MPVIHGPLHPAVSETLFVDRDCPARLEQHRDITRLAVALRVEPDACREVIDVVRNEKEDAAGTHGP